MGHRIPVYINQILVFQDLGEVRPPEIGMRGQSSNPIWIEVVPNVADAAQGGP